MTPPPTSTTPISGEDRAPRRGPDGVGASGEGERDARARRALGGLPAGEADIAPGLLVDEAFSLLRVLGEGAKGRVFEALDRRLERRVALKIGPPSHGLTRRPLLDQARALSAVSHRAFPTVFHAGTWSGRDYLVTELVEGSLLSTRATATRARGDDLEVADVVAVLASVTEGLAELHRAGKAHGNVFSDNALLTAERRVVLLGIDAPTGLAPVVQRARLARAATAIAPEALLGVVEPSTLPALDVYAAGALGLELLGATAPLAGLSVAERLERQARGRGPAVARSPGVPEPLSALLAEMLERSPARRPSAAAAHACLRDLSSRLSVERGKPFAVLVVDPDPEQIDLLHLCVQWAIDAAEVTVASGGEWALREMEEGSPDLVLFETRLPDMSGVELCQLARGEGLTERCAMIALGAVSGSDADALRSLGVRELVEKGPHLLSTLPRLIRALHDERRSPAASRRPPSMRPRPSP